MTNFFCSIILSLIISGFFSCKDKNPADQVGPVQAFEQRDYKFWQHLRKIDTNNITASYWLTWGEDSITKEPLSKQLGVYMASVHVGNSQLNEMTAKNLYREMKAVVGDLLVQKILVQLVGRGVDGQLILKHDFRTGSDSLYYLPRSASLVFNRLDFEHGLDTLRLTY